MSCPPLPAARRTEGDGEDNNSKDPFTIDDSKDPSYRQPEMFDDDELLYLDDEELDTAFKRGFCFVVEANN